MSDPHPDVRGVGPIYGIGADLRGHGWPEPDRRKPMTADELDMLIADLTCLTPARRAEWLRRVDADQHPVWHRVDCVRAYRLAEHRLAEQRRHDTAAEERATRRDVAEWIDDHDRAIRFGEHPVTPTPFPRGQNVAGAVCRCGHLPFRHGNGGCSARVARGQTCLCQTYEVRK